MRRLLLPTAAVVLLSACSNSSSLSPTQPSSAATTSGLAVRQGDSAAKAEQISLSRSIVVFGGLGAASETFVATTKGAGEIISSASPGCLVTPGSAQAINEPGIGHSVTFT